MVEMKSIGDEIIGESPALSNGEVPSKSRLISSEEFLQQTSITKERLDELQQIGWLNASQKTETTLLFVPTDVYKVRKLERICLDFEVEALPAAIIVDLLDKVESLETELHELKNKMN